MDFVEVDAATNSGKAEIKKIIEEIEYSSFSGRKRLYLFDESHQLSKDALDAMLKPLEENSPDSDEKKLVCIFCTTEPEKMRATILSRCAPAFIIQSVPPEDIAKRLAYVCGEEEIDYEDGMLQLIAEITECHIRDALKAVEGVSMLGSINKENVTSYLHLDHNDVFLDILENLGRDLKTVVESVNGLIKRTSPLTCYTSLANLAVTVYQVGIGATKPYAYLDEDRLRVIYEYHKENLLGFASRLSSRPARPTEAMLICDLGHLHHGGGAISGNQPEMIVVRDGNSAGKSSPPVEKLDNDKNSTKLSPESGKLSRTTASTVIKGEVEVDTRAVKKPGSPVHDEEVVSKTSSDVFSPDLFCKLLALRVAELVGESGGSTRRDNLDSSGIIAGG